MEIETTTRRVTLPDGEGLHLRVAAMLAQVASGFQSDIWVSKNGLQADAKSVMDLLKLAAGPKTELTLEAKGPDSWFAAGAVANVLVNGFRNSIERSHT